jgi:ribosomal protein S18 acetylase RimI-like enzyme
MNITGKLQVGYPSEEIIKLDQDFFPIPWTRDQWNQLDPKQNKLFCWYDSEKLIGFALFGITEYDNAAHLFKILINPFHRGTGKSQVFWSAILLQLPLYGCSSIYLEVNSGNIAAIRFYEKCGFKILRKNKAYYSSGEDAVIMSLTL